MFVKDTVSIKHAHETENEKNINNWRHLLLICWQQFRTANRVDPRLKPCKISKKL